MIQKRKDCFTVPIWKFIVVLVVIYLSDDKKCSAEIV